MMQQQDGLSLIEVMVAITIIGLALGSLITVQGRVLRRSIANARAVEHILAVKNFFVEITRLGDKEKPREKALPELDLRMQYKQEPIKPASVLAKLKNLVVERIEATWDFQGQSRQQAHYRFIVQPPTEKAS